MIPEWLLNYGIALSCFALVAAIIFPFAWFLTPQSEYKRISSKLRPAEPDDTVAEPGILRWIWFMVVQAFFWLVLILFTASLNSSRPWDELNKPEGEVNVVAERPDELSQSSLPSITISADGEVAFAELLLPPDDHRLNGLSTRLRDLTPAWKQAEPVIVNPSPETTHQRIIDVLSAVARVRHRKAVLR